ncbi:hypothetical protein [Klebsiella quasipneumoniae]|uniref:hypothetical protein n=1 Tax=Klebsiella quasipneumoniae TaxID=1463165 RepID=UPI000E2ACF90|nr:hypothetical protein [Klebsiella quasipneumoniae]SXD15116.1 Ead domain protein [Klebsiella quasipneumoniae]
MIDITELAQSLKAAAEKWQEAWGKYDKVEITIAEFIRAAEQYESIVKDPANILALVEALEKAQQQISKLEKKLTDRKRMNQEMAKAMLTPNDSDAAGLESRTVTAAAADVLAERKRQVSAEGWTPGHDDEYEHGELADAAGCYALSSELFDCAGEPPRPWPWPEEWWKPTNRRRDLVKAGALILAEIERLDRASGIKVEAE